MIYLELFFAYLQIGLFSIGGGHASIPVAQSVVVDAMGWLNLKEFTDMITISEMTPGPFSVNSATYVGLKMAGILGGIISTLGFLLPSVAVCLSIYLLIRKFKNARMVDGFMQGIRPAVSGVISSAGLTILIFAVFGANTFSAFKTAFSFDWINLILGVGTFVLIRKTKVNPILMILLTGIVGGAIYYLLSFV
ncbi:MAG: chromate transporter [Clostridiales bacterium]|nr:chromate transporter [Clostridiales bacterium]